MSSKTKKTIENGPSLDPKQFELNSRDLEYLLTLIKNSNFQGKDLQFLYELVVKLQVQYNSRKH